MGNVLVLQINRVSMRHWTGLKRKRVLLHKTQGKADMLSRFQACKLGVGRQNISKELIRINVKQQGQHYKDTDKAMEVVNSTVKMNLESTSFV